MPKLFVTDAVYSPFNAWTGGSIIVGAFEEIEHRVRWVPSSRCGFQRRSMRRVEWTL